MSADDFDPAPLAAELAAVPGVVGVAFGGSRARGTHRPDSDWDLGLYYRPPLDVAALQRVIGDRVWFRHAKAGELCEHVNELHLVAGDAVVDAVPTYRGEGQAFG